MNSKEYERHQLKLIGLDYKRRGFKVELEGRIPGVPRWRFDALARSETGETFIIELVNRRLSYLDAERRLKALEAVAGQRPDIKVDFRYIDVDTGTQWVAQNHQLSDTAPKLQQALAARSPRFPKNAFDVTAKFLALWLLHVSLIRAYSVRLDLSEIHTKGALDLYNELLQTESFSAPESIVDEITLDLFELYEQARGGLQGGSINPNSFIQLRLHFRNVKQQAKRRLLA